MARFHSCTVAGEEAIWSIPAEPTYCAEGQGPPSIPEQLSSSVLVPGTPPETARNAARTTLHGNLTSLPSLTRSAVNGNLQRRAAAPAQAVGAAKPGEDLIERRRGDTIKTGMPLKAGRTVQQLGLFSRFGDHLDIQVYAEPCASPSIRCFLVRADDAAGDGPGRLLDQGRPE